MDETEINRNQVQIQQEYAAFLDVSSMTQSRYRFIQYTYNLFMSYVYNFLMLYVIGIANLILIAGHLLFIACLQYMYDLGETLKTKDIHRLIGAGHR